MRPRASSPALRLLGLCVAFLIPAPAAAGSPEDLFQVPFHVYGVAEQPIALGVGSVDGDGKQDALLVSPARTFTILRSDETGPFRTRIDIPVTVAPYTAAVSDLNGDGLLDVVAAATDDGLERLHLWVRNGHGFDLAWSAPLAGAPDRIVAGDVDGDGRPDLVLRTFSRLSVLRADGAGGFGAAVDYLLPGEGTEVVLADLDGDGPVEIVTACLLPGRYARGVISCWYGAGDGTFDQRRDYTTGDGPWSLDVADMDGDGRLDLVSGCRVGRGICILYGRSGGFGDRQDIALPDWIRKVRVADLVEGGLPDLFATVDDGRWVIRENLGGRSFGLPITANAVSDPQEPVIRDVDGDGHLDVVMFGRRPGVASLSLGRGDGTFGFARTWPVGPQPTQMVFADLDGSGREDIAVSGGGNAVHVLLADPAGLLAPPVTYILNGLFPQVIDAGDLNGDGVTDLAVVTVSSQKLHALIGVGNGTFLPEQSTVIGGNPFGVSLADLTGDSRAEAVVTSSAVDRVSVFLGYGDGTFGPAIRSGIGATIRAAMLTSVDADRQPDIVQASDGVSHAMLVIRGSGGGTFGAAERYETGKLPMEVAVARIDGDPFADLAVPCRDGNVITLYTGDGRGGFHSRRDVPCNAAPFRVAAGDVTLDGVPDLVVLHAGSNAFSVLVGEDGSYRTLGAFGTGVDAMDVAARDVDGDGRCDVVVLSGNGVTVYRNEGRLSAKTSIPRAPLVAVEAVVEPNPSAGAVSLALSVPVGGGVTVEIFDALGRRVAAPWSGMLEAGRHEIAWDGRGESGPVASGVYWMRVATEAGSVVRKLLRAR